MQTVFISESADKRLVKYIENLGCCIAYIGATDAVYRAIASHPDIYMCILQGEIFCAPELRFLNHFSQDETCEFTMHRGSSIGTVYPDDIIYNAAVCGKNFIHNLKYTDSELLRTAKALDLRLINVRQGYTKCSTVVVADNAVISADVGIVSAASENGLDVLQIKPGYVVLEGFAYGFLGGASGMINEQIIFNGDLSRHPDFISICSFIEAHGKKAVWFSDYALTDIGSIICM